MQFQGVFLIQDLETLSLTKVKTQTDGGLAGKPVLSAHKACGGQTKNKTKNNHRVLFTPVFIFFDIKKIYILKKIEVEEEEAPPCSDSPKPAVFGVYQGSQTCPCDTPGVHQEGSLITVVPPGTLFLGDCSLCKRVASIFIATQANLVQINPNCIRYY